MRMVTYGCLHVLVCTLTSHKRVVNYLKYHFLLYVMLTKKMGKLSKYQSIIYPH